MQHGNGGGGGDGTVSRGRDSANRWWPRSERQEKQREPQTTGAAGCWKGRMSGWALLLVAMAAAGATNGGEWILRERWPVL